MKGMIKRFKELTSKVIPIFQVYKNVPLWFMDRLHLIPRKKIIYKLRNGVKFILETNTLDCQFINEMYVDYHYTGRPGFQISSTDLILDCGAHKGIFTVFASKSAFNGKVISYEASPSTYQFLLENIKLNDLQNVEHFNAAVGLVTGQANFYMAEDPGCSMVVSDTIAIENEANQVIVPQVGFSQILEKLEVVDFLKMDVEGVEFDILMNSSKESLQKVRRIAMEYHPEFGSVDSLVEYLNLCGFETSLWEGRRMLYAWRSND